jgi:hypothetical protein
MRRATIPRVYADTLLHAQQQHLLRLLLWAALSVVGGTGVFVVLAMRRLASPLLMQFGIQTAAWGLAVAAIAAVFLRGLHLRDLSGEARLERLVWLSVGLDMGCICAGSVLAVAAWVLAKRLGGVGAGIAIAVQGVALLVIELQFAALISR